MVCYASKNDTQGHETLMRNSFVHKKKTSIFSNEEPLQRFKLKRTKRLILIRVSIQTIERGTTAIAINHRSSERAIFENNLITERKRPAKTKGRLGMGMAASDKRHQAQMTNDRVRGKI